MRDDRIDRQIALDDLKKRIIDLTENKPELPGVAWDAEPVRYFKLNQEWCILLAGWLDHMESEAFWPDAEGQDYAGIQAILKFEEGIELPVTDFDCGDVEDCLETSETIANLNTLINQLEEQIDQLEDQIGELEDEQATDTVDIPPTPDMGDSGNDICRGADFISRRLGDLLLDMWEKASTLTLQEFMSVLGSIVSWGFIPSTEFWQYVFTVSNPELAEECQDYLENIRQAFFCSNWELEGAIATIQADGELPSDVKALWVQFLSHFRQSEIDEYGQIGILGETEFDCTGGCPWIVVYKFGPDYVAIGDEDEIIEGDTWDVENGDFVGGTGYDSNAVNMIISKSLPEQCRVTHYGAGVAKASNCGRADVAVWYRGPTTEGEEQWTAEQFTINNLITGMGFNLGTGHVLSTAKVAMQAVLCGPGDDGMKISWVRLVGTGNRPS